MKKGMKKGLLLRMSMAAALLLAAAAPVWAALEGVIDYSGRLRPEIDASAITASIASNDQTCGPVYMPTLVHERDGSIVGTAYVLDGDDC